MKQSLGENTLANATTVWAIGTYDKECRSNFMTAAWGEVCSLDLSCIGV
jgi:flavin reductase (DIM6/NTAB) family NADH-FMN oxidoreductase RutF